MLRPGHLPPFAGVPRPLRVRQVGLECPHLSLLIMLVLALCLVLLQESLFDFQVS